MSSSIFCDFLDKIKVEYSVDNTLLGYYAFDMVFDRSSGGEYRKEVAVLMWVCALGLKHDNRRPDVGRLPCVRIIHLRAYVQRYHMGAVRAAIGAWPIVANQRIRKAGWPTRRTSTKMRRRALRASIADAMWKFLQPSWLASMD